MPTVTDERRPPASIGPVIRNTNHDKDSRRARGVAEGATEVFAASHVTRVAELSCEDCVSPRKAAAPFDRRGGEQRGYMPSGLEVLSKPTRGRTPQRVAASAGGGARLGAAVGAEAGRVRGRRPERAIRRSTSR
jgi:hypothetical protein